MIAPVDGSGDWPAWIVRVVKPWRFLIDLLMVLICIQSNHSNDLTGDLRVQMKDAASRTATDWNVAQPVFTGFGYLLLVKCAPGCRVRRIVCLAGFVDCCYQFAKNNFCAVCAYLTGAGGLVAATAVLKTQLSNVGFTTAVEY